MKKLLEIACFNIESCVIAQNAGADRVEFCRDYASGGLTPLKEDILSARKILRIPLHVIIRPAAGNFFYTETEIEQMKRDIVFCKENKIDGIVTGLLTSKNEIDITNLKELVQLSKPLPVTFHRAIDQCNNMDAAIQHLIHSDVKRVLSSGFNKNALTGKEVLSHLQKTFGKQICIMPGGGIRSNNLEEMINTSNCKEFHSAAINGTTEIADAEEIKALAVILSQHP